MVGGASSGNVVGGARCGVVHAFALLGSLALQDGPAPPPPLAAAAPSDEWRVVAAPPAAGDAWEVSSALDHHLVHRFRVRGVELREHEQLVAERAEALVELRADADRGLVARIDYRQLDWRLLREGADATESLPEARRSFEVTLEAGELRVVQLDPRAGFSRSVIGSLADRVARDAREALQGGWLAPLLAERQLVEGQAIEVPLELGEALLEEALAGATLEAFTLTPTALRQEAGVACVVLAAAVRATLAPGEPLDAGADGARPEKPQLATTTALELAGECAVRRDDGRIVALSLSGPLQCTGSAESGSSHVEIAGTGTLRWTYRALPAPR
ncbi:MAG: hypothetical protein JNL90_21535 [Planctomycetes bacterium]|nr:hypothetical protein [Planctomycetota bacterium]